ncbi:SpvB/TcaC N-terminal domain-containing protein [Pseudoalteromonas sp. A601]|uniref:SpvB/TcaC N-terminal domain-containing protein n=1 Tax=Pseudoalteromonas sp. A601 TaxID=1967839 RepID=UPI001593FFF8|nr:SpvB/TcaC N-terminal domain-containing protein [Pseudoalteromonas sp. A601]
MKFKLTSPAISPNGGNYSTNTPFSISNPQSAVIKYKMVSVGAACSDSSWLNYTSAVTLTNSQRVCYKATKSGRMDSNISYADFNFKLEKPSISPAVNEIIAGTSITLSINNSNANLQYKLVPHGASCTSGAWLDYSTSIVLDSDARFCAKATALGWTDSDIVVNDYRIQQSEYADISNNSLADSAFSSVDVPTVDNIGAIKGQAGVSGGAATYHIPIQLPTGRAGMQPEVSLNYSSRNGNGIAGVGWSLSAGSSITRCAATYAQDGFTQNPQYNSNDRLCLDGQRLIATSGSYGNSGTQYRTEIDSFVRVTQSGALNGTSTWFKAEYKNSRVAYFGKTTDSRLVHGGKSAAYSWLIEYQHDATAKNYIHYEYEEFGVGETLLTDIYYSGNSSSLVGHQRVSFIYNDRADKRQMYIAGGKYSTTQILKHINLISNSNEVKAYNFNYITSSASSRSLLDRLAHCFNGICINDTTFRWQDEAVQFDIEPLGYVKNNLFYQQYEDKRYLNSVIPHGDTNGDGVRDFGDFYINAEGEYIGKPSSPLDSCRMQQSTLGANCVDLDIDLDGKSDYWFINNELLNFKLASGEVITTQIPLSTPGLSDGNDIIKFANDLNGDGWTDIVVSAPFGNGQQTKLIIYFHTQNRSQPYTINDAYDLGTEAFIKKNITAGEKQGKSQISLVGDIDGNGLPDFAILNNWTTRDVNTHASGILSTAIAELTIHSLLLNMSSASTAIFTSNTMQGMFQDDAYTVFGDINGDGLSDLLDVRNAKIRINEGGG